MNEPSYHEREDDLENALNRGALWAVTYGDMMSYLMIFFLVLFTANIAKKNKKTTEIQQSMISIQKIFGGKIEKAQLQRIEQMKQEDALAFKLRESQKAQQLSQLVQIQSNEDYVRLVLPEAISFQAGEAELKDTAKTVLAELTTLVKDLPNDIIVEGHTDSIPVKNSEYINNFFLSAARAYNVIEFLTAQGIDKSKLSGLGYAENRPVASNDTPEGRAKNRRVEIVLVKTR